MSWSPETYLAFADHRERPIAELISRIPAIDVARAVDLGCGTGNSTAAIAARFPGAKLTGVDNSPEMLAKAHGSLPRAEWVEADLSTWQPAGPVDLVASNAALQWVDGHADLFAHMCGWLKSGGALALQMPRNFTAPSHLLLHKTVEEGPWAKHLLPLLRRNPVAEPDEYYALLAPHMSHIDIWETTYQQILEGEDAVFRWTSGTAMRPFLAALEGAERDDFCETYKEHLRKAYPKSPDRKTLFPFTRLFIVAVK